MLNKLAINTGAPRNVAGHFISAAIATSIVSGALNYRRYENAEITKSEFIKDTLKKSLQGAIATSSAIATSNYIGEGKLMQAMTVMSIGAMGVYGTQKVYEKLELQVLNNTELENAE
jgi:hypothetical protein